MKFSKKSAYSLGAALIVGVLAMSPLANADSHCCDTENKSKCSSHKEKCIDKKACCTKK